MESAGTVTTRTIDFFLIFITATFNLNDGDNVSAYANYDHTTMLTGRSTQLIFLVWALSLTPTPPADIGLNFAVDRDRL